MMWIGEAEDARANFASLRRKLQRALDASSLSASTWAQLEAAVLAREAELALTLDQTAVGVQERVAADALSLLSSSLHVCLNSRSPANQAAPAPAPAPAPALYLISSPNSLLWHSSFRLTAKRSSATHRGEELELAAAAP